MKFDGKAFGQEIVALTRAFVERSLAPIVARLVTVEQRLGEVADLFKPPPTPAEFDQVLKAAIDKALADRVPKEIAALELKVDGAELKAAVEAAMAGVDLTPDPQALASLVAAEVAKAMAAQPKMPTAEDVAALVPAPVVTNGKDADPDVIKAMVSQAVTEAVAAVPPAEPGKDATPEAIAAAVETVLATWDRPKDGESVTIEQLQESIDAAVDKAVAARPVPKDGVGLAGALIDHEGGLAVTLTDGTIVKLGRVVGKDGEPGKPGLESLDDIEVTHDGGRQFAFRLVLGDRVKDYAFTVPAVIDRGVYKEGAPYEAGDAVTWANSLWVAKTATTDRPGTESWRMQQKRPRDGKDCRDLGPSPAPPTVKL